MAESKQTQVEDLGELQANPHAFNCHELTTEEWLEIITDPEVRASLLSPPKSAEEVAERLIKSHTATTEKIV